MTYLFTSLWKCKVKRCYRFIANFCALYKIEAAGSEFSILVTNRVYSEIKPWLGQSLYCLEIWYSSFKHSLWSVFSFSMVSQTVDLSSKKMQEQLFSTGTSHLDAQGADSRINSWIVSPDTMTIQGMGKSGIVNQVQSLDLNWSLMLHRNIIQGLYILDNKIICGLGNPRLINLWDWCVIWTKSKSNDQQNSYILLHSWSHWDFQVHSFILIQKYQETSHEEWMVNEFCCKVWVLDSQSQEHLSPYWLLLRLSLTSMALRKT